MRARNRACITFVSQTLYWSFVKRPSEAWFDEIQEDRELANATINKMRGTFSMIFKHGKRKDLVNVNPAADVPLRDVGHGIVERFLSADEEKRLPKCSSGRSTPTIPSNNLSCASRRSTDSLSSRYP